VHRGPEEKMPKNWKTERNLGKVKNSMLADDTLYRYWDATAAVEFGFAMAEQALDVDGLARQAACLRPSK
jgi:hypothetical protein